MKENAKGKGKGKGKEKEIANNGKESRETEPLILAVNCLKLLSDTMISLLNDKTPISDDLLLISWKFMSNEEKFYEILNSKENSNARKFAFINNYKFGSDTKCSESGLKNIKKRLWNALSSASRESLEYDNQCKARDYFWFKNYLLESNIWFQKVANPSKRYHLLFENLEKIVDDQLSNQRALLDKSVAKMNETKDGDNKDDSSSNSSDEHKDWLNVINFEELQMYGNKEGTIGIRQDCVIDEKSGQNIMADYKGFLQCDFSEHDLDIMSGRLSNNGANNFDVHHYYDVNIYLNRLLIAAHNVDYAFQKSVKRIYGTGKFGTTQSKTAKRNVYTKQFSIIEFLA